MGFDASKIRDLCKDKGITLSSLAEQIGISNQGIQSIFKNNVTTIATLEKICNALDVQPNYFFGYDKQPDSHLNNGNITTQHSAGDIRDSSVNVVSDSATMHSNTAEIEKLKSEIEYLRKQIIDKDELIAMQKEFIENLKRQVK